MVYVINENYKHNIIWCTYFNKRWKIFMNKKLYMEVLGDITELHTICVMIYIPHVSYKERQFIWAKIDTILYYHIFPVMPCTQYKECG